MSYKNRWKHQIRKWIGFMWAKGGGKYYFGVGARACANRESRIGWGSNGRLRIRFSALGLVTYYWSRLHNNLWPSHLHPLTPAGVQLFGQLRARGKPRVYAYARDIVRVCARVVCVCACVWNPTRTHPQPFHL